jgi:hypothetical protein
MISPTKKVIGKFINNNHQTQGEEDGYNQGEGAGMIKRGRIP